MSLGPVVELETTNLSGEELCDATWLGLAPKLNW